MAHEPAPSPDLLEQIPDPETVRSWLSESVQRTDLLRSLLRLAKRKASYRRPSEEMSKEGEPCPA